jgi:pimeloyl-ACP methyl ester carboxylesterase
MKPGEYRVGGKDSVGLTIKSILGQSNPVVVYTTENDELRWDYNDEGTFPEKLQPAINHFDKLIAQIKASTLSKPQRLVAYELLGKDLFRILNSAELACRDDSFRSTEEFLKENGASPRSKHHWKDFGPIKLFAKLSWPARIGAVVLVFLVFSFLFAMTDAWLASRRSVELIPREGKPGTDELLVLTHGYTGSLKGMEGVIHAIRERRPDADILFFGYPASIFSNADPFVLANQLEEAIAKRYRDRNYSRIILSGHSIGGLLIRKAFVYGRGSVEDLPLAGQAVTTREPHEWTKRVDRIVLLAGMNRGWSAEERPQGMSLLASSRNRFGMLMARLTGTGKLVRGVERGEPFVANLRLQWLATMERAKSAGTGLRAPIVIQLLGDRDDTVSREDSRDVTVTSDFVSVGVNNTGHGSLIQLAEDGDGLERKRKIQQAFGGDADIEELKRVNPVVATETDPNVTTVVFVLHGIRDMGEWTSQFKQPLEDGFTRQHEGTKEKIYVHRAGYGYFPMGSFLLWADRQKNVRWFMDQVTELRARFPRLKDIHFIGHSNGTYVLASALRKYRTLKVGRVVFAGSVVRRDFPWSQFVGRVDRVRNYVGSADWVVGFFPKLFELPGLSVLNPDLGSAGFTGFMDGRVKDYETQFIQGGHGAALNPQNVQSIVDFILDGSKTEVATLKVDRPNGLVDFLSRLCWIVWLFLAGTLVAGGWLVMEMFDGKLAARLTPVDRGAQGKMRAFIVSLATWLSTISFMRVAPKWRGRIACGFYCAFVLYLLNTY